MTRPTADNLASELPDDEWERMACDYAARLDDDGDVAWLAWRDRWVREWAARQPRVSDYVRAG